MIFKSAYLPLVSIILKITNRCQEQFTQKKMKISAAKEVMNVQLQRKKKKDANNAEKLRNMNNLRKNI